MMVLITYDVETTSAEGRKRLRRVAKICTNYGQRVQNSVFECIVNPAQLAEIKYQIEKCINKEKDSVRYYYLGSTWSGRVEHIGTKISFNPENDNLIV
ncbi:MAG: CRISPR-associated endonuclease Cas2 [Bacteroidales bacterium]